MKFVGGVYQSKITANKSNRKFDLFYDISVVVNRLMRFKNSAYLCSDIAKHLMQQLEYHLTFIYIFIYWPLHCTIIVILEAMGKTH